MCQLRHRFGGNKHEFRCCNCNEPLIPVYENDDHAAARCRACDLLLLIYFQPLVLVWLHRRPAGMPPQEYIRHCKQREQDNNAAALEAA